MLVPAAPLTLALSPQGWRGDLISSSANSFERRCGGVHARRGRPNRVRASLPGAKPWRASETGGTFRHGPPPRLREAPRRPRSEARRAPHFRSGRRLRRPLVPDRRARVARRDAPPVHLPRAHAVAAGPARAPPRAPLHARLRRSAHRRLRGAARRPPVHGRPRARRRPGHVPGLPLRQPRPDGDGAGPPEREATPSSAKSAGSGCPTPRATARPSG